MGKYVPVGDGDFDGIVCDLDGEPGPEDGDESDPECDDGKMRHFAFKATTLSIVAAIAVTGGYGMVTGDCTPLAYVWSLAAAPVGAALALFGNYVSSLDGRKIQGSR